MEVQKYDKISECRKSEKRNTYIEVLPPLLHGLFKMLLKCWEHCQNAIEERGGLRREMQQRPCRHGAAMLLLHNVCKIVFFLAKCQSG